jgi:hypothetical protein
MHNINFYLDLVQIKAHDKYHIFSETINQKKKSKNRTYNYPGDIKSEITCPFQKFERP